MKRIGAVAILAGFGMIASGCAWLGMAPPTAAGPVASEIADACTAEQFRQFDFWLGHWDVNEPGKDPVASNHILRVAGGCALLEAYRHDRGFNGQSLSWYDAEKAQWRQLWLDSSGLQLKLAGGSPAPGQMRLEGKPRTLESGETVRDRITWTALDDGRVRQLWEISRDEGGRWQTVFDGYYQRQPDPVDRLRYSSAE